MRYYPLLLLLLLISSCHKKEIREQIKPYDAWIHRSEWKANSFGYNWELHSNNKFTNRMPIFYKTTASNKDYHVAIELADLDSSVGTFDSLQIEYTSTIPLSVTLALLPEDKHGFELRKNRRDLLSPSPKKSKKITLTPADFGEDWHKKEAIPLARCNNIAIGNRNYLTPGQDIFIQIKDLRLFHSE